MKRISITVLCLFIFISVVEPVNHNIVEYPQEDNSKIRDIRNYGNVVTLTSDDDCDDLNEDGVCDEKGMVGLKLDVPTTGEIIAFVLFIVIIVGFPLFLIFRIVWKLLKWRIYHKNLEIEGEGEVLERLRPLLPARTGQPNTDWWSAPHGGVGTSREPSLPGPGTDR